MIQDPVAEVLAQAQEWAAGLPPLPEGFQYKFEAAPPFKFDTSEIHITMRAVPTRIVTFEED